MHRTLLTGVLLVLSSLLLSNLAHAVISPDERNALIELYNQTGGDNWLNNNNWLGAEGTECSWYGVSCDVDGNFIRLDLKANNLLGSLPSSLTVLPQQLSIDLRFNAVYSDDVSLVEFLDARGPVGTLHDTQTLNPDGISISSVTETGFTVSWTPVNYEQAGGYRIYLAQLNDSDYTNFHFTEFVKVGELSSKADTSYTLSNLSPCNKYFVRISSFTTAHADSPMEMESDLAGSHRYGTIPGYANCTNLTFSINISGTLSFNTEYNVDLAEAMILMEMDLLGNAFYTIYQPGEAPPSDILRGCTDLNSGVVIGTNTGTTTDTSCWDISVGGSINTGLFGFDTMQFTNFSFISPDAQGGTVVNTMQVNNPDSLALTYAITAGNSEGLFEIDEQGQIILTANLTTAQANQYTLTVQVTNELQQSDTTDVTVSVLGLSIVESGGEVEQADTPPEDSKNSSGGCSLRPGAAFDPVLLLMLVLSLLYPLRSRRV